MLSDGFIERARSEHGALADEIIEELSSYIASNGDKYENHEATVDLWIARRREKQAQRATAKRESNAHAEKPRYGNFDPEEAFRAALERSFADA